MEKRKERQGGRVREGRKDKITQDKITPLAVKEI